MSANNDFSGNIDDILAEFSSFSSELIASEGGQEQAPALPQAPEKPALPQGEEELKSYVPRHAAKAPAEQPAPVRERPEYSPGPEFNAPSRPGRYNFEPVPANEAPRRPAPEERPRSAQNYPAARRAPAPRPQSAPVPGRAQETGHSAPRRPAPPVIEGETRALYPQTARRPSADFDPERLGFTNRRAAEGRARGKAPAAASGEETRLMPRSGGKAPAVPSGRAPARGKAPSAPPKNERRGLFRSLSLIFTALSLLILSWVFINIHPDSGTISTSTVKSKVNLMEKMDNFVNNTASSALDGLVYIPKIYTIPEDATVAPKPSPSNFGSTTDPADIMAVIESAGALLDGQEVVFNPNANFVPGAPIQWYLDDTILAITWQEDINDKLCSCSEIKLAHGSQIRRKLADDTYNSGRQYYASDMAKQCNAIVAINGDFYANRTIGISAYNRELYRFTPNDRLDSCAFTGSGDMLFIHAGELYDEAYTKEYMEANDVVFLISFGPILIENGELKDLSSGYPIGEIDRTYSRTGIAQLDTLHYFTMNINYGTGGNGKGYGTAATLQELGQYMHDKGCGHAYTLDGGQTSVLLMNGELVNHVDFGNERLMSDIIYFATAIPEEEAAQ